jgi:hypothetical protein
MIDWTFDLIFPRDISILVPNPEDRKPAPAEPGKPA